MRPLRSFLLLLVFLASLTGLCFIFPSAGLFPSIHEFLTFLPAGRTGQKADTLKDIVPVQKRDTLFTENSGSAKIADTLTPVGYIVMYNPLQPFIDSLRDSKGQVRIMYYGDSQVEGDRITFYLRRLLRKGRNGTGPGLFLPVMPVMYTKSVWLKSSSNWIRYNYLSWKKGKISQNKLGPFMAVCRYLPEGEVRSVPQKAFIRIRPSSFADSAASIYDILRIFYSSRQAKVTVRVSGDDREIFADSLKKGQELHEISCDLGRAEDIQIEFEGRASPDIYGISIESRTGIIVDNIPQRGSAGLEFTMVDRKNLEESFRIISPDLFILHYGLNIVRNVRNDYSYYEKGLQRQISLLKEVAPATPVLVVGVTDMAANEGDSVKSYKNIPAIVDSQKEAALKSGAAFWDSYNAMGGRSSIITWTEKKIPLAQKDYVHFTYPGADTLSKMLALEMFSTSVKDTLITGISENKPDTLGKPQEINEQTVPEVKRWAVSAVNAIFRYDPAKPFIFTTPAFWLFFLIVMAGYSLIYRKLFLRNFYLLLASLFFYYKSGGLFLSLLILITIIDFICGLLIFRSERKVLKRLFITLSILSNLLILAYFKYAGFFINTINDVFGTAIPVYDYLASFSNLHLGTSFDISSIILPVGISFFTFQSMSYTLDVYRGKLEPVRNIFDFGFYVSFFPQLVAGPIVRASEFIPQLYRDFSLSKREFSHALFLISKGLIKKIIISDFIATNFVDRVFDLPSVYSGFENLMAIYGYGLQIYCDFSGYTDIAIGLGLIMGFRLPVNFNSPYKAAGIADFWKRWHISLSRWLKDYLYISLGGNRKGTIRTGINLIITMLLGGLWHGASLRFVIWGGLHGIGLVFNKIWNAVFGERLKSRRLGRALAVFITFNFVSFCWIFFRAPDMNSVSVMLKQIFGNFSPGSYLEVIPAYSSVFLLMAVGYLIHFLPERVKESYRGLFIRIPLVTQMAVIFLIAVLIIQMRTTDVIPFIYFRF
jgi:alginate O-acetyltransferase complex protein AlgI